MKVLRFIFSVGIFAALSVGLSGCVSESPFLQEREGRLRMRLVFNSDVTRAGDTTKDGLYDNCVVRISNSQGLIHRWVGVGNVPDELMLRYGSYTAEAWSGDSVPASFDKKFFRGYQTFQVNDDDMAVVLDCKIRNVVTSINTVTVDGDMMKDWSLTVASSTGELRFDASNMDYSKGYFMMPFDKSAGENGAFEDRLTYTVTGRNAIDEPFTKTGEIKVESAHEYKIGFKYDSEPDPEGGAFIGIVVEETEITDDYEQAIYGRPTFDAAVDGVEFDLGSQLFEKPGDFSDLRIRVSAYMGLKAMTMKCSENLRNMLPENQIEFDLVNLNTESNSVKTAFESLGITFEIGEPNPKNDNFARSYINISKEWLNSLPAAVDSEGYQITITAVDRSQSSKEREVVLRIGNSDASKIVEDPVAVPKNLSEQDYTSVRAKSVTVPVTVFSEETKGIRLQYREQGSSSWDNEVPVSSSVRKATRADGKVINVTLTDLKPGTVYQYRVVADGFEPKDSKIGTFTTEAVFSIVNGSFEDWSTYTAKTMLGTKSVVLPGNTGNKDTSFWGSGNEGAATANMTLTDKSADMFGSGTYSARLESKSALGVLAAGNIFVGSYVETDGTNGVLSLGREYNASHPSKLIFKANYRPGSGVKVKSGNESFVPDGFAGGSDHGQVYVALTTEPVEIRTNPNNRKLFDKDGAEVIAYGEVTWTGNFGPDGALENVEITLDYNDRAKTAMPKYLVIVASASKYGDYFSGAAGSVMYLDDFELVYE